MASTLALVPIQAVVYAASNTSNTSNTTTSSSSGAAGNLNVNWKAGVAMGALMASPIIMALGL